MAFDVDSFLDEPVEQDAFDVDSFLDEPEVKDEESSNLKTYGERLGSHAKAITGGLMQQGASSEDIALGAIARLAGEPVEEENIIQSTVKNALASLNLVGSLGGYIPRKLMPWAFEGVDEKIKAAGEELASKGMEGLKNKAYTFEDNSLGYHAANIGESLALMVPTLALGATGAGATVSLSAMLPIVYGEQFAKSKDEGRNNAEAAMDANFNAITEMVTEIGPFNMAFKASQPALSRVLKTAGMEGLSEVINEGFQRAYEVGVVDNDTTTTEFLDLMTNDDAMRGYRDAAIAGTGMGTGMGVIGEVAQAYKPKDPIEVSDQVQSAETVDDALSSAQSLIDEVDIAQPEPVDIGMDMQQVEGLMPEDVMPIDRGEARYKAEDQAEKTQALRSQYDEVVTAEKAADFDKAVAQIKAAEAEKETGISEVSEVPTEAKGYQLAGALKKAIKERDTAIQGPTEVKDQAAGKLQPDLELKQAKDAAIQAPVETKKIEETKKARIKEKVEREAVVGVKETTPYAIEELADKRSYQATDAGKSTEENIAALLMTDDGIVTNDMTSLVKEDIDYANEKGKTPTYAVSRDMGGGKRRYELYDLAGKRVRASEKTPPASNAKREVIRSVFATVDSDWVAPSYTVPAKAKAAAPLQQAPEVAEVAEKKTTDSEEKPSQKSILGMTKSAYLNKKLRTEKIKKDSPGYADARKQAEEEYESDLDKAEASLPFEEYNERNSESPESINRQAHSALRQEFGFDEATADKHSQKEPEVTAIAEEKHAIAEDKASQEPSPRKKHLAAITVNYEYNGDTQTGRASSKAVNDHVVELKGRISELNKLISCLKG